jgi:hypothetical protein
LWRDRFACLQQSGVTATWLRSSSGSSARRHWLGDFAMLEDGLDP